MPAPHGYLGVAHVDLLQRLADVRKPVVPVLQRRLEELLGQRPELREQIVVAGTGLERVAPRCGAVVTGAKPTSQKPMSSNRCL